MTTLPHLQTLAASMQALARPNPDQAHPLVIRTRLAQLDFVFWSHEFGDYAGQVWGLWEDSRAALMGMLAVAERAERVPT